MVDSNEFMHGEHRQHQTTFAFCSFPEHPLSEELNDSINCKVAKLELDNEALQNEMKEAKQQLSDAQMEVARLKVRRFCSVVAVVFSVHHGQ